MSGPATLVRTASEPAGANCASGGTAILLGVDTNTDGQLQDAEVTSRTYVCAAAQQTLVRVEPEAAGQNCPLGGVAVLSGRDTNADGMLADGEVQDRRFVCGQSVGDVVVEGDVFIRNSVEYQVYRRVRRITGRLVIGQDDDACCREVFVGPAELDFPNLETVGQLQSSSTGGVRALRLPRLTALTFQSVEDGEGGTTGRSYLENLSDLEVLELPQLQGLGHDFSVRFNARLNDCAMRARRASLLDQGLSATLEVSGNGGLADGGVTCPLTTACWVARPSTSFPRNPDGGQRVPPFFPDAGQGKTFAFCDVVGVPLRTIDRTCAQGFDGGRGAILDSVELNSAFRARANQFTRVDVGISGQDEWPDGGGNPDGGWAWGSGAPFGFSAWAPGEPNDVGGEDCLQVNGAGRWNDVSCTTESIFACELP
jgi:hypothetical protein